MSKDMSKEIKVELTPIVDSYLVYVSKGKSPKDALESAVLDTVEERSLMGKKLLADPEYVIAFYMHAVYSFLRPDVVWDIKYGARLLQFWFLNFEALEPGQLDEIKAYIDDMKSYFKA